MIISTSKRQRLTPLGDVTHVSDSVHGSQLERTLRETQQRLEDTKIENAEQAKQIRDLQAALARSESAIQDHLKQISQLRDTTSTTTLRLQEQVSAHGQLQHRYESRTNEVHKLRKERDDLTEKIAGLETKRDNTIKENTKLKEERVQLQSDLSSARNDLKSAGGTTADIEVLREENRKLAKEKASAEKRNVSTQSDLDFTRQLYQEVSTKVASTANENGRLELENGDLKRKAENAAAHLKNLSHQRETDSYLRRTEELEATLASRDELLKRKEEELRELRKGRGMGTRASSVQPRSPRLGNSRPVSPAPGNLVPMQMVRGASALRYPQEFR
jgi:chromosome segregation ATPase